MDSVCPPTLQSLVEFLSYLVEPGDSDYVTPHASWNWWNFVIGGFECAAANWRLAEFCDWWIGMCRSQSAFGEMFAIGGLGCAAANRRMLECL